VSEVDVAGALRHQIDNAIAGSVGNRSGCDSQFAREFGLLGGVILSDAHMEPRRSRSVCHRRRDGLLTLPA